MPRTDIRQNADGTITCIYGRNRSTFTPLDHWTHDEILEHCKWELVGLGASLAPAPPLTINPRSVTMPPNDREETQ